MGKTVQDIFTDNLINISEIENKRDIQGKCVKIAEKTKAHGKKVAVRTIRNVLEKRHFPGLDTMEAIAIGLDVPLWLMLIPDLSEKGHQDLISVVDSYKKAGDKQKEFILQAALNATK